MTGAVHESAIIEVITRGVVGTPDVIVGVGDDAAVLAGDPPLVVAHDMMVQDVHFRWSTTTPADLGHAALAVNLSDIAAMGARPMAALVGLAFGPDGLDDDGVAAMYAAMRELGVRYGCPIVGGDTSAAAQTVVGVTVIGRMPRGVAPVLRGGGSPGDVVCVTGAVGASAAGLAVLGDARLAEGVPQAADLCAAHLRPEPRLDAGEALARLGAHAMLDCSDGLAIDLDRLARASGVVADLDLDAVPLAPGVAAVARALGLDAAEMAATGGEDYELIVALPPDRVAAARAALGVDLTVVAHLSPGRPGVRVRRGGRVVVLDTLGWEHRG